MNKLKQITLLLCGCILLFAACEREEDTPANGGTILIPPTGDPVAVTFTISENHYGGTEVPTLRTAASPNPSEGGAFPPPSGESEGAFSLSPVVPKDLKVLNDPSYFMTASIHEKPPAIHLRATQPFNHPGHKLRIAAYDTLSYPGSTILLAHADYEVDPADNLAPLGTAPMAVPTGSVLFVAYSFNDTIPMPPFSPTVTAIGNRDLLWGDTLETIDHTNSNVHLRLDHLFSKITLEVEVDNGNPSGAIDAIFGARYDHTFPTLNVLSGELIPGITDTLHFRFPYTGSARIWQSDDHYAYTHGDPPVVTVDSITIDGTTHTGTPWTTDYVKPLAPGNEWTLYMCFRPYSFAVNPDILIFEWNAVIPVNVTVTASQSLNWTVTGIPAWLTVTPQSGTGAGSFTVVPNGNNPSATQQRTATLTVTAGSQTRTVAVRQFPYYGEADLLYFASDGTLQVGKWGAGNQVTSDNLAYFKFGSTIGFTNVTANWAASEVKFNTHASISTFTTWNSVPGFTTADANNGFQVHIGYHTLANVLVGRGDPCQLVGYTGAQIRAMNQSQFNAINSGWRLPHGNENNWFFGGPYSGNWSVGQVYYYSQGTAVGQYNYWTASGAADNPAVSGGVRYAGGWFPAPPSPSVSPNTAGGFLPAAGRRLSLNGSQNEVGISGAYWTNYKSLSNNTQAYVNQFTNSTVTTGHSHDFAEGNPIRCVRTNPIP